MCLALLDGRAWTAGELATHAGIARSTASEHLHILVASGVLSETRQGRHRYVRLADENIAEVLEHLATRAPLIGDPPRGFRSVTTDRALARARMCYDHLAGSLGVAITDALLDHEYLSRETGLAFTSAGIAWADSIGVDLMATGSPRRPLARPCLDWTERRDHLAGSGGAALCAHYIRSGWVERSTTHRGVTLTGAGEKAFRSLLSLKWPSAEA
jgi:DNA-binding MarR family transcriptional regulator